MRTPIVLTLTAALVGFASAGCDRIHSYIDEVEGPKMTTRVIVLDASKSISEDGRQREANVVKRFVLATTKRGDRVILLPVMEDADSEASGHSLSLQRSSERSICDADSAAFEATAEKQIDTFLSDLQAQPGRRTDLLGALRVANEYLESVPAGSSKEIIVLSDFIQDTGGMDFDSDPRLANSEHARQLALTLTDSGIVVPSQTKVMLGEVGSTDLGRLSPQRRDAIRKFWQTYMSAQHVQTAIQTDGVGQLQVRLQEVAAEAEHLPIACKDDTVQAAERR